jgi:hypothetical protein
MTSIASDRNEEGEMKRGFVWFGESEEADVIKGQAWTYSRTSTEFLSQDAGEGHCQGGDAEDCFHCSCDFLADQL